VEALKGDVLAIAKLMSAPPNLNTLWMQAGEPTLQLVEMSRWGDPAKTRISGFMSNKLYVAWSKSTVQNTYSPFVSEFAGINNAVMAIADPAVKTEARLLLKSAVEQVFASCKKDGREPPPHFLYAFAFESVGVPHP